jgi:ATP-dependent DNA helicase RecG
LICGRTRPRAGLLTFGRQPLDFLPGAHIQFTRYEGRTRADLVRDHRDVRGALPSQLAQMDHLLQAQIQTARVATAGLAHVERPDYPLQALREFVLNAVWIKNNETRTD